LVGGALQNPGPLPVFRISIDSEPDARGAPDQIVQTRRLDALVEGEDLQLLTSFDELGAYIAQGLRLRFKVLQKIGANGSQQGHVCKLPKYFTPVRNICAPMWGSHKDDTFHSFEQVAIARFPFMGDDESLKAQISHVDLYY
jgi:hypothetical protein